MSNSRIYQVINYMFTIGVIDVVLVAVCCCCCGGGGGGGAVEQVRLPQQDDPVTVMDFHLTILCNSKFVSTHQYK